MNDDPLADRIRAYDDVVGMAQDSMALLAAFETGVFAALLAGPATAPELGDRLGVSGWRLGAFLDRVVAQGFLVKDGGTYALVAGDEGLFDGTAGRTRSLGFADSETFFGRLARGADVLRTDQSLAVAGTGGDAPPAERARFLRYLHERSQGGADEVASELTREPVRRVLDLGSGMGTYATAILRRATDATAVLVDRPNAGPVVAEHLHDVGLSDRARFIGGDFLQDDLGGGFDLAVVSNIVHNIGSETTCRLLRRVHGLLLPGGRVAIKDLAIQPDRLAPASAGRFALTMALFTERGGVFPAEEAVDWLGATGFTLESMRDLVVAKGSWLVVGRRA